MAYTRPDFQPHTVLCPAVLLKSSPHSCRWRICYLPILYKSGQDRFGPSEITDCRDGTILMNGGPKRMAKARRVEATRRNKSGSWITLVEIDVRN